MSTRSAKVTNRRIANGTRKHVDFRTGRLVGNGMMAARSIKNGTEFPTKNSMMTTTFTMTLMTTVTAPTAMRVTDCARRSSKDWFDDLAPEGQRPKI